MDESNRKEDIKILDRLVGMMLLHPIVALTVVRKIPIEEQEPYAIVGTLVIYIIIAICLGCIIGAILIFIEKKVGVYIFVVMYILFHVFIQKFFLFFCAFMVLFFIYIRKVYKYMN